MEPSLGAVFEEYGVVPEARRFLTEGGICLLRDFAFLRPDKKSFFDDVVRCIEFAPANKLKGPSTLLAAWVAVQDIISLGQSRDTKLEPPRAVPLENICGQAGPAELWELKIPPIPLAASSDSRVQAETWCATPPGSSRANQMQQTAEDSAPGRSACLAEEAVNTHAHRGCLAEDTSTWGNASAPQGQSSNGTQASAQKVTVRKRPTREHKVAKATGCSLEKAQSIREFFDEFHPQLPVPPPPPAPPRVPHCPNAPWYPGPVAARLDATDAIKKSSRPLSSIRKRFSAFVDAVEGSLRDSSAVEAAAESDSSSDSEEEAASARMEAEMALRRQNHPSKRRRTDATAPVPPPPPPPAAPVVEASEGAKEIGVPSKLELEEGGLDAWLDGIEV